MAQLIKYLPIIAGFLLAAGLQAKGMGQPVQIPVPEAPPPKGESVMALDPQTEPSDPDEMVEVIEDDQKDVPVEEQKAPLPIVEVPKNAIPMIPDPYYANKDGHVMRYIKGVGWRKFSPEGAHVKDWWDFKKTLPRQWGDR